MDGWRPKLHIRRAHGADNLICNSSIIIVRYDDDGFVEETLKGRIDDGRSVILKCVHCNSTVTTTTVNVVIGECSNSGAVAEGRTCSVKGKLKIS